jgi:hypothetical protein
MGNRSKTGLKSERTRASPGVNDGSRSGRPLRNTWPKRSSSEMRIVVEANNFWMSLAPSGSR